MTKSELWAEYVRQNPSFNGDGKVTLSAAGLRKMFNLTWEEAEKHRAEVERCSKHSTKGAPDFFKDVFGGKY